MQKKVLVLGCTGSIGSQTIDIIRKMPDSFKVAGLCANSNKEKVLTLSKEFDCPFTLFADDGIEGIKKLVNETDFDIAVNGVANASGLLPSIFVLEKGKDLALANKETVVMAWDLVKKCAQDHNARIIPVDSEHSAIFNLLEKVGKQNVDQLLITASGGPFRNLPKDKLESVTVEDALKHPTWNMGTKITIDSATLGNKGLEVIEAVRLFGFPTEKIKVVIHPQSIVHSMVRTNEGMIYAQLSNPDMRRPIFGALTYPENIPSPMEEFDIFDTQLTFQKPRYEDFPLLELAFESAKKGNQYTIAYNASNEIAVDAFIKGKIKFNQIPEIVEDTLANDWNPPISSIEQVLDADQKARELAQAAVCSIQEIS